MSYTPAPGTTAYRVLSYLQTLPAGAEVMTSKIADALGLPPNNVAPCLDAALKAGAIYRRQRDDHVRSPFWWSLVDHTKDSKALDAGHQAGGEAAQAPHVVEPGPAAASTPTNGRLPARTESGPRGSAAAAGDLDDDESNGRRPRGLAGEGDEGAARRGRQPDRHGIGDGAAEHHARLLRAQPPGAARQGDADAAGAGVAPEGPTRFALWSDGTLHIQRPRSGFVLTVEESRALVAYLDSISLDSVRGEGVAS